MKKILVILCLVSAMVLPLSAQSGVTVEEGWETGDFTSFLWERPGTQHRWEVTSEGAHGGRYCVRSGNYYTINTESVLRLAVFLAEKGTMSYYRKVSSDATSGVFRFWIDDELQDSLSGHVDWSQFQCMLPSGFHVLKFSYRRNSAASLGSDCVWLDDLQLPNCVTLHTQQDTCAAPPAPQVALVGGRVLLSLGSPYHQDEITLFDDVEGHTYGAINSPGTVGWNYIDGDAAPTGTFSSLGFLNEGAAMAFIVLDDELVTGSSYPITAHSGHRFLGSPYHSTIDNDDWIVSPRLHFTEPFTFSFHARCYTPQFPNEKFVVYYSLTDSAAASFIPLHSDTVTAATEWTEYSFLVPPAARYVALRCISHDQYILCLDDLSIRGRRAEGHICNIYRDGELIASQVTDSVFVDSCAGAGMHCYFVTYDCPGGGESPCSDTVCVMVDSVATEPLVPEGRDMVPADAMGSKDVVGDSHMASTLDAMLRWNKYPTYSVYTQLLQYFRDSFPNLCRIDTILRTTPHPDLHHSIFAIHIGNTLGQATTKPAFLYSSTMHGTEVVGFYMMLRLADYILNNAATDSAVQRLLDSVDLYICPLENPDGTYYRSNDLIWAGGSEPYSIYHNYNDVQLNRNYPHMPGLGTTANIQPETQAIIDWVTPIHFVMSANFHCGAELLNYPWDSWTTGMRPHADADWFRYTCQNYATLCHAQDTAYLYGDYLGRSVIDGGDWSVVYGSRQDYMTYYQRCREVTMEICQTHVVTDTLELPTYWTKSKDALLSYAMECSYGFWGTVTDAVTHEPVEAMVRVVGHDRFHSEVFSHLPLGAYHRPIMAGTYTVEVSAPCYQTATFTGTTRPGVGIRHDVQLQPLVTTPEAYDQYILSGMQTTVVALSQNEVWWYDADTAVQPIAIGSHFTTPPLFDTTTYYLEERRWEDSLWCVSPRSSVTVYVVDAPVGIDEEEGTAGLVVYPNPAEDYLTVEAGNGGLLYVEVIDAKGVQVLERIVTTPVRLDISPLLPGLYFLRTTYPDGRQAVTKFIKSPSGGHKQY